MFLLPDKIPMILDKTIIIHSDKKYKPESLNPLV